MSEKVHVPMKPAATPARRLTPSPSGILQRKCACGGSGGTHGECEECKKKYMTLQRHPAGHAEPATVPAIVHDVLRSSGQPLDAETRAFFESRFGHDFNKVSAHTGVRPVGGVAVSAFPGKLQMNRPSDHYEQEAERVANQVMRMTDAAAAMPGRDRARASSASADAIHYAASLPAAGRTAPPTVNESMRSHGRPHLATDQTVFGGRLGHDFSGVRIHTDDRAAKSAQAVSALAYTAGQHIVFGPGRYAPRSSEGRRLLAHELTHTIQQTNTASPSVMGVWDKAAECSNAPTNKWIQKVVVNQETPQRAAIHWSDGSTESDECSSGKGHCCVDASNPSGVACTVERSRTNGSNCTPITRAMGYPVRNRVRDHKGVEFWTEFVPHRAIALHQYAPVDGSPLSHGCVRLHRDFATKIFCSVRQNATWVQVHGFARPSCDRRSLQEEWQGDFTMGGMSTSGQDGEMRGEIRETRRELSAAFGRELKPDEINAFTAKDIPRCRTKAPLPKPKSP